MKRTRFKYEKAHKITQSCNQLDSLLELKYALSIQDEYEFMRARIVIYYHHGTFTPDQYIREGIRHFTPDFLIRHKATGEAFLIEIKPRAAQHEHSLYIRKKVAEKYIQWKGYDWKYKVVFEDEIILDHETWKIFETCRQLKSKSSFQLWMVSQDRKYSSSSPVGFLGATREQDIQYIMFGSPDINKK